MALTEPAVVEAFLTFEGEGSGDLQLGAVVASAAVCFALTPQLAEQLDYIRFMPPRTRANRRVWWTSMLLAGPGWVIFSGTKQLLGVLLAVYVLVKIDPGWGTGPRSRWSSSSASTSSSCRTGWRSSWH